MSKVQPLSQGKTSEVEKSIRDYWKEINLFSRTIEERDPKNLFIFYEGPPTANGKPGIHHVISRILKDSVCRYKTMKGYQVRRKAGWDTHGLPVEIEVEKKLGIKSKQEIEEYGIEKFNEKCRESVFEYESMWREMTEKMAYAIDLDHPYITLDNNYIETVWWILDKFNKEGMIYEGHKILPYCSRCGTGLASHEVAQGYKEIKTNTVIVKFKKKDADEYFLVWTTTPWTLASNVALTVNADNDYVKVMHEGTIYYVEKNLASKVLGEGYQVLETYKGKDMEYWEYEQLMDFCKVDRKAFYVTCAPYVTTEDGTGIVHTAPAFGEDDYSTGRRYNLPVLQPVDETGKYTDTPWRGMFVMDADIDIIKWLAAEGKLFKKEKMDHNYPHCWRCNTPLLYYAKPSWYIEMTKIKDKLIESNNNVNWFPDFVGEKRFGNWLESLNDWAISRSRYWGTPLNIWRCECGNFESIGSRKELKERAVEDINENIELHRPFVDDVHIKCSKCEKTMTRVKDVIDCWFDSGSMPFAQWHYPFENKEKFFDELFPADFICEGIDQTRGWFYSLIAISTFLTGKAPYMNVLVNDLILDKDAQKMSKSKGNVVDPFMLFDKYGVDALRWYLFYVSPAWAPTKFDEEGLKEVLSKFFLTLRNICNFFTLYASTDNIEPDTIKIDVSKRAELDLWVLSKYNSLVLYVDEALNEYDHMRAVRKVQDFVNEDLSNWYIRRSRRRFWDTEMTEDKKAVYATTYEVLTGLSKIIAPFVPYIAEEVYRSMTGGESVHLEKYPVCNKGLININLEEKMDIVKSMVSLGRAARENVRIKVRQPLSKMYVDGRHKALIGDLASIIMEELNIKEVIFENDLSQFMDFKIKPNFKVAGPMFGPKIKNFGKALEEADQEKCAKAIEAGETVEVSTGGDIFKADKENTLVTIKAKVGYDVSVENNIFVVLDTNLTKELVDEGYAREFISKIQQMRKNANFEMMDNIYIAYTGDSNIDEAVSIHKEYILSETLGIKIEKSTANESFEKHDLNGHETYIKVSKNNH